MIDPVIIGNATLYCADCRTILPHLPKVDAVVTDPPYGQCQKVNTFHAGGKREKAVMQRNGGTLLVRPNVHPEIDGDQEPFDPRHLLEIAPLILIWGSHKFGHLLPRGRTLVWDKVPNGKVRSQGDGETAWTNVNPDAPLRIFRLLWDGLCVGTGARHEVTAGQKRLHPMQKPELLMRWCLNEMGLVAGWQGAVLDPFMGSGTTGVACVELGRQFIGIELDADHFATAERRIAEANASKQGDLFGAAA